MISYDTKQKKILKFFIFLCFQNFQNSNCFQNFQNSNLIEEFFI